MKKHVRYTKLNSIFRTLAKKSKKRFFHQRKRIGVILPGFFLRHVKLSVLFGHTPNRKKTKFQKKMSKNLHSQDLSSNKPIENLNTVTSYNNLMEPFKKVF